MEPAELVSSRKSSKPVRTLVVGTLLAVLVFFALSFLTVLRHISPVHYYKRNEAYRLAIGFPWTYYEQFWLRGEVVPNSGWHFLHLIYDCLLTWLFILTLYVLWKRTAGASHL